MTAATKRVAGIRPVGDNAIPSSLLLSLTAGVVPYEYQLVARTLNATASGVIMTAVTGLIPMGQADGDTPTAGAANGDATVAALGQWFAGYRNSATAGDTFVDADFGRVAWAADNQTIGKSEVLARSMVGVFVGMTGTNKDETRIWGGFPGYVAARSIHLADHAPCGLFVYPVDVGAGTALAETVIPRSQLHGTVTGFRYIPSATLAADATNYKTITISKRTAALPGTAVVLATLTSVLGFTAFTPRAFTLSAVAGVLDLLPTDILTIVNTYAASGAVVPVGAVDGTMEAR